MIDKRKFEFDRVYDPSVPSREVFAEISPLITSFVDGYVGNHTLEFKRVIESVLGAQ